MIDPKRLALLCALAGAAVALAACGSSSSSDNSTGGASGGGGGGTTISSTPNMELGKTILTDSSGHTLYLFEKDEADESYCNGACATVWPPVATSGGVSAAGGVDPSKLSTLKRDDGTTQVVYASHPLYTYDDDHKPGQVEGEGSKEFGAEWYAVEPSGDTAEPKSESGKSSGDES